MEMLLLETRAADCKRVVAAEAELMISAGTLAEALIVAGRRGIADKMEELVGRLPFEVVPVTVATARRVAQAYGRWGKGVHPAGLNFGDCFAYEAAKTRGVPLLFIGDGFARTDIEPAL